MSNPELRASEGAAPPVGVRSLPEPAGGVKASPASFTLTLPLAPSTNNLFVNAGRTRRKSADYRTWLKSALVAMLMQRPKAVRGPIKVAIAVPVAARGDLDNRIKAALDFCVSRDLIDDDRHIQEILIRKNIVTTRREMVVTVTGVQTA